MKNSPNSISLSRGLVCVLYLVLFALLFLEFDELKDTLSASNRLVFIAGVSVFFFCSAIVLMRKKLIRINIVDISILLFVGYMFVVDVVNESADIGRLILSISFVLLYLSVRLIPYKFNRTILIGILFFGLCEAIYGNLQLYGICSSNHGLYKLTGHFFNPGPYSGFLAIVFSMALPLYLYLLKPNNENYIDSKSRLKSSVDNNMLDSGLLKLLFNRKGIFALVNSQKSQHLFFRVILLAVLISVILVLPAAQSRAAWLAVIFAGLFSLVKTRNFRAMKRYILFLYEKIGSKTGICVGVGLLLLFGVGLYFMKQGSVNGRLLIWKASLPMVTDAPLLGHGSGSFQTEYMNYQGRYFSKNPESQDALVADNSVYAFNEPLKLLVEHGVVGLVLIGIVFFLLFFKTSAKEKESNFLIGAKAGLIAFGMFGCFSYPTSILPIGAVVMVCVAIVAKYCVVKNPLLFFLFNKAGRNSRLVVFKSLILIIAIGWGIYAYSFVKEQYVAHVKWKDASDIYDVGGYEACIDDFAEAYPMLKQNGRFLVNYGKALAMAKKPEEAIAVLEEAKQFANNTVLYTAMGDSYKMNDDFQKAEEAYWRAYYMIPSRFYPLYLLAKLYEESGQHYKAVETAQQIMKKPIKIDSKAITEIKSEMRKIIDNE